MALHNLLIGLSLSEAEKASLKRALGASTTGELQHRLDLLGRLALEEYVEWLVGRRRFNSISEADLHRLIRLFIEIRREPPTLEVLANDVGLSPGRAASMASRMRYGRGQLLVAMSQRNTYAILKRKLEKAIEDGGRKAVWVESEVFDLVMEVATNIMTKDEHLGTGKGQAAPEMPTGTRSKWATSIAATTAMWQRILELLLEQSNLAAIR